MIGLWAKYAIAARPAANPNDAQARELEQAARVPDETGALAAMLLSAVSAPPGARERRLDDATAWLRHHHPAAAQIWQGSQIRDGRLIHEPPR
jgi:hypothetical protein